MKFNTGQGLKGAEFLTSPKNLIFRQSGLQDGPACSSLGKASESLMSRLSSVCSLETGSSVPSYVHAYLGIAMTQAPRLHRFGGFEMRLSVLWTPALSQLGPPGGRSRHLPEGSPSSSKEDAGFAQKIDQCCVMIHTTRTLTVLFVIIISGFDF